MFSHLSNTWNSGAFPVTILSLGAVSMLFISSQRPHLYTSSRLWTVCHKQDNDVWTLFYLFFAIWKSKLHSKDALKGHSPKKHHDSVLPSPLLLSQRMEQVVSVFITRATFVNFKQQGRHKYAADPILSCAALAILGTVWCWFLRSLNHPSSAHFVFPPASWTLRADSSESCSCKLIRVLSLVTVSHHSVWQTSILSQCGEGDSRQKYSPKDVVLDLSLDVGVLEDRSQHCVLVVPKLMAYWAASAGA